MQNQAIKQQNDKQTEKPTTLLQVEGLTKVSQVNIKIKILSQSDLEW